ncbi:hypothetical protein ADEAN_000839200 [Angomonas deanei]|uniref:Uncharacterized protein n=1 Tax=Angomonas deanei TaxID=59799 RepID=A0A7G2CLZ8_9TRYP|nr:hypothetical protein ADEAN_000839200 [Angomonas deanei]
MLLMANPQSLSTLGWGEVWLELPAVLRLAAPEVRRAWGAEVPLSALLFNFTVTSSALQPASTSKGVPTGLSAASPGLCHGERLTATVGTFAVRGPPRAARHAVSVC